MKTVGELCNRHLVTIDRRETVLEAARRMRTHHVGSIVLVDEKKAAGVPVGLVTDRDIVVGVVATASPYLDSLQVGDLVTDPLVTAREDESVPNTLKKMRAHGIRRVPIVDRHGQLAGVLSFDDLVELIADELSDLAALLSREQRRERASRA